MRPLVTPSMKKSISSRDRLSPSRFFLMTSCGLKLLSLVAPHESNGLNSHSYPLPHRIDSLARLRLYTHTTGVDAKHARDIRAHRIDVGPEFWLLEQDCRIDVNHMETAFTRQPHYP